VNNGYNEIGQLTGKNLHKTGSNSYLQNIDYSYNIRGWLTAINNADLSSTGDLFGMELKYNAYFTVI
jgi:hypothetical protein